MDNKSVQWPSLLSQIPDPPEKLYYVGAPYFSLSPSSSLEEGRGGVLREDVERISPPKPPLKLRGGRGRYGVNGLIAVVGSRQMSKRGEDAVRKVVPDLVKRGVGIVSGLALGVDTLAHQVCLDCGGYTVAVMGMGLDRIYPWENKELAEKIVANGGCLLSEYEVGHKTIRSDFLKRNRIVSGLCAGTLVVEAAGRSGSISTPNFAVDQGREVWVVEAKKGEPNSEGILALIEDGATVVRSAVDIVL